MVKNSPANAGDIRDVGWILMSEISPGGGHGNPLNNSCLGNHMDGGAWGLQSTGLQRVGQDWVTEHTSGARQRLFRVLPLEITFNPNY